MLAPMVPQAARLRAQPKRPCPVTACIADTFAVLFRGAPGGQARVILWVANTAYVTLPIFMIVCWGRYTNLRTSFAYRFPEWTKTFNKILLVLAVATTLLALSTPLTGFAFTLDEQKWLRTEAPCRRSVSPLAFLSFTLVGKAKKTLKPWLQRPMQTCIALRKWATSRPEMGNLSIRP